VSHAVANRAGKILRVCMLESSIDPVSSWLMMACRRCRTHDDAQKASSLSRCRSYARQKWRREWARQSIVVGGCSV
jgi:uracil-DNA glycosylase